MISNQLPSHTCVLAVPEKASEKALIEDIGAAIPTSIRQISTRASEARLDDSLNTFWILMRYESLEPGHRTFLVGTLLVDTALLRSQQAKDQARCLGEVHSRFTLADVLPCGDGTDERLLSLVRQGVEGALREMSRGELATVLRPEFEFQASIAFKQADGSFDVTTHVLTRPRHRQGNGEVSEQ